MLSTVGSKLASVPGNSSVSVPPGWISLLGAEVDAGAVTFTMPAVTGLVDAPGTTAFFLVVVPVDLTVLRLADVVVGAPEGAVVVVSAVASTDVLVAAPSVVVVVVFSDDDSFLVPPHEAARATAKAATAMPNRRTPCFRPAARNAIPTPPLCRMAATTHARLQRQSEPRPLTLLTAAP